MTEYFTIDTLAHKLGTSRRVVRRLVRRGEFRSYIAEGELRVSREAVEDRLAQCRNQHPTWWDRVPTLQEFRARLLAR